jgi:hypothetical protein
MENNEAASFKSFEDLITTAIQKKIEKSLLNDSQQLAISLGVGISKDMDKNKQKNKQKKHLVNDIKDKLQILSTDEKIDHIKKCKIGMELEVKHILENEIPIDELINIGICLPLHEFLEKNPELCDKFTNTCDLENVNNNIKSSNCVACEVQGLYILTINKNGIDYIVKLGSFAESQGMFKRICSFGGGNHETGSATNKWFQRFIKKALAQGYTSKFTYYNKIQEKINITDMDGNLIEMMPYVMRPLETQLFKKYNETNHNIPPIFGSNCL